MRESLHAFCVREEYQVLLNQWVDDKNLPLTPNKISRGSKNKVWWQCEKGHQWQAAVYTRTGGRTGCPVCAGKVAKAGENDLAYCFPELARQWNPTRNGRLTAAQVLPGSHRLVWWQCENGHEWRAQIKSRVAGSGCPVCVNRKIVPKENGLAVQYPELVRQWHPTKNGAITPDTVAPGTTRKVWWVCERGHEWQASIASRTSNGTGCPVCAGKKVIEGENDLFSQFPTIAAQWHSTKNAPLKPQQVTPNSNKKVWWRCEKGHEYQAAVSARIMHGSGCPYCSGRKVLPGFNDLATLQADVAKQWHGTLNGTLTPQMVTTGSHRKVWWECEQGHVWQAVIYSRTGPQKCGCPICGGRVSVKRLNRYQ